MAFPSQTCKDHLLSNQLVKLYAFFLNHKYLGDWISAMTFKLPKRRNSTICIGCPKTSWVGMSGTVIKLSEPSTRLQVLSLLLLCNTMMHHISCGHNLKFLERQICLTCTRHLITVFSHVVDLQHRLLLENTNVYLHGLLVYFSICLYYV